MLRLHIQIFLQYRTVIFIAGVAVKHFIPGTEPPAHELLKFFVKFPGTGKTVDFLPSTVGRGAPHGSEGIVFEQPRLPVM